MCKLVQLRPAKRVPLGYSRKSPKELRKMDPEILLEMDGHVATVIRG